MDLDTLRSCGLGYRWHREDWMPHWAGKLIWRPSAEDRDAYDAMTPSMKDLVRISRRARLLCEINGELDACAALARFEKGEPDRDLFLRVVEGAQFRLQRLLRINRPALTRAYGDLHVVSDWLHRQQLGIA